MLERSRGRRKLAEAKHLAVPFLKLWHGHGSESDGIDFASNAAWAGLDADATEALAKQSLARAVELVERPEVWAAVLAVAERPPNKGRVSGAEIARIVAKAVALEAYK